MRAWKPILAALVIFTAGVSIGHLVIPSEPTAETERRRGSWQGGRSGPDRRGGQPGRPPWSPVLSEEQIVGICGRMTADLELTTAQSNEISMILKDSQARMKAIADEYLPRTRGEFFRTREAIQAVLTEEQLAPAVRPLRVYAPSVRYLPLPLAGVRERTNVDFRLTSLFRHIRQPPAVR